MTSDTEATELPALMSTSRDGWTSHFLVCFACAQVLWTVSCWCCEVYHPGENHTVVVSPVGSGSPPSCLGGVVQLAWCYCCFVCVLCSFVLFESFFVLFFGIVWVSCIQRCCSAAWAATCATNNLRLTLHLSPSPSFFECVFFRTRNFYFWIVEPRLSFSGANLRTLLVLLLISSGGGLLKFIQLLEETTPVDFTVNK